MHPWVKTMLVLLVAITALNLGRYSMEFSGRWSAWTAVIAAGVALVGCLSLLIRDFWKSNA
jgi:hypothetical protein